MNAQTAYLKSFERLPSTGLFKFRSPKGYSGRFFLLIALFLLSGPLVLQAQYTDMINSNRPGNSQGAFSVGTGVIQFEAGAKYGTDEHSLAQTRSNLWGIDYALRMGFWREQLEISFMGTYLSQEFKPLTPGSDYQNYTINNFEQNTLGVKYLLYDPYKNKGDEGPNLYSWRANQRFDWSQLIPAVSLYAGLNIAAEDNPYLHPSEGSFTPKVAIITQNNFEGGWVFVLNLIGDKITDEFPSYIGIATLTHSFNQKFAAFAEFQTIISDIYSDEIARAGLAYLIGRNLQLDLSGLVNFKDTPSRWQVAAGVSYRFDFHQDEEFLLPEEL